MSSFDNLRLERQLCLALYDASRAMTGCYRPMLDKIGLTYSQYAVMLVMWNRGETTLSDLGQELSLDSGTLSPLLKRLASQGYVERRRNGPDERVLHVAITEAGRAIEEEAAAAQVEVERRTGMDSDELAALRDNLRQLTVRLRADP